MEPFADPPRLVLPPPIPPDRPPGFPVAATIAPVAGALLLWAVTASPLSLVFAALGPLAALASLADARRSSRRRLRRERDARAEALERLRAELRAAHGAERAALEAARPTARGILSGRAGPPWHTASPRELVVGTGPARSAVRVEGMPADETDRQLLAEASRLERAPLVVDLDRGIGLVGPSSLVRGAARALLVQLAHLARPDSVHFVAGGRLARVVEHLPHRGSRRILILDRADTGEHEPASSSREVADAVIALAGEPAALPPGLGTILELTGPRSGRLLRRDGGVAGGGPCAPDLAGETEATSWATSLEELARRSGFAAAVAELPTRVGRSELAASGLERGRASLRAELGIGQQGVVAVDLVADGPHAIVAGTTGSGKSAFLVSWIAGLAARHPPDRVAFLLVDFKGGAAFEPLRLLPHVAGVVSDLDGEGAARALDSLRAELARRERVLRDARVADLAELPVTDAGDAEALPRLVIVVDEFQALMERHPELGVLIGDLAARGRSLGIHLVLAAQRPLGVVRDAVAANCSIRVCLRVLSRSDSVAVIGVDTAAGLPAGVPGRALLDPGTGIAVPFQSALADEAELRDLALRHSHTVPPRRPWLDPLPARIPLAQLVEVAGADPDAPPARGSIPFGALDEPERQRRSLAVWCPERDGPLLVLGVPGSGRSGALHAIGAGGGGFAHAVVRLGGPASAIWDALLALEAATGPLLVLIDDLDRLVESWDGDYRQAAVERLGELLRSARARSIAVCASATRMSGAIGRLRDDFPSVLLLRQASRADLVHAGGVGALWRRDAPPGSGQWRERAVQLVEAPAPRPEPVAATPLLLPHPDRLHLLASGAPRAALARWRRAFPAVPAMLLGSDEPPAPSTPGTGLALVGDAEGWAAQWSLLAAQRETAVLLADGPAELRALTRLRELPPLLDRGAAQWWRLDAGGPPVRVAWPEPAPQAPG